MLVIVSIVAFVLLRLAPDDPALIQAGPDAGPETVAAVRHELALDQPWPIQYLTWASHALRGDLGQSYSAKVPVSDLIGQRLPVTLQIAVLGLLLIVVVGVPLGVLSALRRDGLTDRLVQVVSLLGVSVPNIVVGGLVVLLVGWLV